MIHNQQSGSLYPDKSILDQQLEPTNPATTFHSDVLDRKVSLWSKAVVDLPRLSTLVVNNKIIYGSNEQSSSALEDSSDKVQQIFDEILLHSERDPLIASSLCQLTEQSLALDSLKEIAVKKGIILGETHSLAAKKKVSVLDISENTFKLVQEQLYETRLMQDPDIKSYFKAKIMVSGNKQDLAARRTAKLDLRVAYTKEYPLFDRAKKANYFGTRAAGYSDTDSYTDENHFYSKFS